MTFANDQAGAVAMRLEDLENKQTGILGMTGSGKTNTAYVLIEQALAQGYGVTTIGLRPVAAFLKSGLDTKTTIITAEMVQTESNNQETKLELEPLAAQLATQSVESGIPVVFRSLYDDWWYTNFEDRANFLRQYLESLLVARQRQYAVAATSTIAQQEVSPYFIFMDEADALLSDATKDEGGFRYSSQSKKRLKETLLQISEQGRQVGVTLIYLCQSPVNLEINLLTTTANFIFHRLTHSQIGEMLPPHCINTATEQQLFFDNLWRESAFSSLTGEQIAPFALLNQADIWDELSRFQRGQAIHISTGQLGKYFEVGLSQTITHFSNFQGMGHSPEGSLEQWLSTARKFGPTGNTE